MICWDYGKKHSYKFVDLFVHGLSVVDAKGFIKGGRKRICIGRWEIDDSDN